MALDISATSVGIACSDYRRIVARPLRAFYRKTTGFDKQTLHEAFGQHNPVGLVVGWPLTLKGDRGARCQSIQDTLKHWDFSYPVCLWDERFSTQKAVRQGQKKYDLWTNALAASLFLNDFLLS